MSTTGKELSETDLAIRRSCYQDIRRITTDPTLTDREKLNKCLNVSYNYYALTGDDSLTPEPLRKVHDEMIEQAVKKLEKSKKIHAAREKDAATGNKDFFS